MYDLCIVGSGAGAAPIAYELSLKGKRVLVLEKGSYYHKEDMFKDEIDVARRNKFTPDLKDEQHMITTYNSEGKEETTTGYASSWSFWNGSLVGGSSNLMSGYFHRMKPNDFRLQSTYGDIEGANIVDWVIDYNDLEPYYEKVEKVIGVSGEVVKHKFQESRSTENFPFPKTWEHPISRWIDKAAKELNYESIPTPRAVLPYDALGRSGCSYSNFCGSYGCATDAKSSARTVLDKAVKLGCEVRVNSFVYHLECSDTNKITHLQYYDAEKKSHKVEAKIFVVSAQAIESVRLLFNSKSKNFPNGLGNNYNQLGKNLIFSAGGSGEGTFDYDNLDQKEIDELSIRGAFVNRSFQDWYEYGNKNRRYKGGTIDFLFEHANPIPMALSQVYEGSDLIWGEKLLRKVYHKIARSRTLTFEVFNDWLPTDKCFVDVSEDLKDKYGVNVGHIHLYGHPHDLKVGEYLAKKSVTILKRMGCENIHYNISSAPPPNLVAGGCRFGADKTKSVLDKDCKVHEIDNLYVSDASFMPTGGSVPYTWTIYANSFRVADAILKRFKS